jgi:cytochrome c nitrite reductase small subunit
VTSQVPADSLRARPSLRARLRTAHRVALALAIVVGVAAGIGTFTFRYAHGFSYFRTDPHACVNCHIMQPQYTAWQHSSHRAVAVCVDCHLPHSFIPKYLAKAENGFRHAKLFTTQTFAEPIVVQARGREILQENCVRCHEPLVDALVSYHADADSALSCTRCHAGVGHVERAGLGGPLRAHELRLAEENPR